MAVKTAPVERLWTTAELAERYGMSPLTLRNWRCAGIGPRSIKVGRNALYPESEVARWEANRRRGAA
jgi:predicted DNA-binding transcriptional regulator AlpA